MSRCLELAAMGIRKTAPNPLVGAVIVRDDRIMGEGFHRFFGGPHAEAEAVSSVRDKSLLKSSTLYVNLEPCNHHGKTPPCVDLILETGIPEVVIAHQDPFATVNGAGIARLKQHGVNVITGVLENEARFLNRRFITFHKKSRPYIILKWAMSADGYMGMPGKNVRISNEETSIMTHKWRAEEPAVLVGSNTVLVDDPQLNTRYWPGENPMRIILDQRGSLPFNRKVFDNSQPTLIFTTVSATTNQDLKYVQLETENFLASVLDELFKISLQSVLVEGGAATLNSFIENGYWDEIRVFKSEELFSTGIKAPELPAMIDSMEPIGNNTLLRVYNRG